MPCTTRTFGFDVTGLAGYRVEESRAPGGGYLAVVKAGNVRTFLWDDATQAHTRPCIEDRDVSFARSNTCKGAVKACHGHAAWVRTYTPAKHGVA